MGKYEEKIKNLLEQMTVAEKVGQLQQRGPSLVGAFTVSFEELLDQMFDGRISQEEFGKLMATAKPDWHEDDLRAGMIGSYNGINDVELANHLQKIAVEESRLGIPVIIGCDVIHGYQTVTPIPLAEACAWDPNLWKRTARMAAEEASANGIHMTFSPMVDVAKDARWGRVSEGAGEDALLSADYGVAKVEGYQQDDLSNDDSIVACVKHFAAYGAAEAGRDYNRVDMSKQRLYEEYLPSYEACVKAGARAIMPAFNDINGVPCSVNTELLQKVLRQDWGFNGMTVSDANAIAECVNHGIAEDRADAARQAIHAGMDMDMSSNTYVENLEQLVNDGVVPMEELDRAVADVLRVKFELGLFDHPYRSTVETRDAKTLTAENRALAREAAAKSMVLLKNENNLLPIKAGTKIYVAGDLAEKRGEMLGAWAVSANGEACVSLMDALTGEKSETNDNTSFALNEYDVTLTKTPEHADLILLAIGETKDQSGEAASRASITVPEERMQLFRDLKKVGKPIAVILFNGRPLAIPEIAEQADAILEAWHPGVEAGNAICDVLFGAVNPSGKLTTTFPYTTGQCPMYYARINTGRPGGKGKFTSKYLDTPLEPVYPFGYGLSYTEFSYTLCRIEEKAELPSEIELETTALKVSAVITNIGDRAGEEIVQCYIRDLVGKRVRPLKQLVAYEKISLEKGESKKVTFEIPFKKLGYYDPDMNFIVEPGKFQAFVGRNAADCEAMEFEM